VKLLKPAFSYKVYFSRKEKLRRRKDGKAFRIALVN
jgi:hypothetical protein